MRIVQYFLFLFLFYQNSFQCFIITSKNAINELAVCIKPKKLKDTDKFQHSPIPIALPILSKLKLKLKLGLKLKTDLHHKFHLNARSATKTKTKTIAVAAATITSTGTITSSSTKTNNTNKNTKGTTSIPTKKKRPKKIRKRSKALEALIQEDEQNKKQSYVSNIDNPRNSHKLDSNDIDSADSNSGEVSKCNNVKLELLKTNTDSISKYHKSDFLLKIKKTNNHIYATVIDKCKKKVVCTSCSLDLSLSSILGTVKKTKTNRIINNGRTIKAAWEIGKNIARKVFEKGIFKVHFDRGRYRYNGRIEAFVEGARSVGLSL